jgi:hypothetical protein
MPSKKPSNFNPGTCFASTPSSSAKLCNFVTHSLIGRSAIGNEGGSCACRIESSEVQGMGVGFVMLCTRYAASVVDDDGEGEEEEKRSSVMV